MRNTSRRTFLHAATAALASPLLSRTASAGPLTLVLVTGAKSLVDGISRAELKRMFLGDPVSIAGVSLVPFNAQPKSAERVAFEKAVLGMTSDEVVKTWVDKRIRGVARPPKVAPDALTLAKLAAAFPGALTYVVPAFVNERVKVLALDGKKPGDAGYLLTVG